VAKQKLTKLVIEKATPGSKDCELRDTEVPGFLCKVTPAGNKTFMVQYRTLAGIRRKPKIGLFGELTVEQARAIAKDWLGEVRKGGDPSAAKAAAREALNIVQLCSKFIEEYSEVRNKPRTVKSNQGYIDRHIVPVIGGIKVADVTRADVTRVLDRLSSKKVTANRVLSCLRKMFNMAEVWLLRPEGSNPCRLIKKHPETRKTRCFTDEEMQKIHSYLHKADTLGLEHPTLILAARLQFEFAGRECEIINLEWDWVDLVERRISWPDSKTGSMDKVMGDEAFRLLSAAHRYTDSPFVCPAIFDSSKPLSESTYWHAWARMLERAGVAHQGTHAIRHRAATEIANSGVPIKDGMAMTGHKTVEMFLSYVHPDEQRVRKSVEKVSAERRKLINSSQNAVADQEVINHAASSVGSGSLTARGNYRPYRKRTGFHREAPPGSRSASPSSDANQQRDFSNAPQHIRREYYFRREDLFKLVWTAPIAVIAVRIGVSNVGLAKACRKAQIPLPGRGHWTRVSTGQSLSPPELSPTGGEIPDLICIAGSNDPPGRLDPDLSSLTQAETSSAGAPVID
jgi:integrase